MTVGIAACCKYKEKAAVVLCCDWQGTTYYGKGDYLRKLRNAGERTTAVIAGDITEADELLALSHRQIKAFEASEEEDFDLSVSNYLAALRAVTQQRRLQKIDHELKMTLGMSAEDFWKNGKQSLLEPEHQAVLGEIRKVDLGASIVLATLTGDWPEATLVTLDADGKVSWDDTYCAIGTGAVIAMGVLSRFNFTSQVQLEECLFRVLLAKRTAESDPNVGHPTSLEVRLADGPYVVTGEALIELQNAVGAAYKCPVLSLGKAFLKKE